MRSIAFLGGINVGGHRVKMERLKELFEELKLTEVETFIASGNVLFRQKPTAALEARLERHLEAALGYAVPTYLRTLAEVETAVREQPLPVEEGHSLHVCFLRRAPDAVETAAILGFESPMDRFAVRGRELYWLCHGKITGSQVNWKKMARQVGIGSTARNVTMLRRLLERPS